jgi:hypothetical protein
MHSHPFPIATWGIVLSFKTGDAPTERIRIEPGIPSGFIMITKEREGMFDVWVETEADVVDFLDSMVIRWEQ